MKHGHSRLARWIENLYDPRNGVRWAPVDNGICYLASNTFAIKCLYIINHEETIRRLKLHEKVLRYRNWRGEFRDYFKDRDRIIAETRQAMAALAACGVKNRRLIGYNYRAVEKLPWDAPWASCSHWGHALYFAHLNRKQKEKAYLLKYIESRRRSDGFWGNTEDSSQLINGAMKVIMGYAAADETPPLIAEMLNYCIKHNQTGNGCYDLNIIVVMYHCLHRGFPLSPEMREFVARKQEAIEKLAYPEGAFSFYEKKSQNSYYGAPVTDGLEQGDIHGAHLYLWTLKMCYDILGVKNNWRLPIT